MPRKTQKDEVNDPLVFTEICAGQNLMPKNFRGDNFFDNILVPLWDLAKGSLAMPEKNSGKGSRRATKLHH